MNSVKSVVYAKLDIHFNNTEKVDIVVVVVVVVVVAVVVVVVVAAVVVAVVTVVVAVAQSAGSPFQLYQMGVDL